MKSRPVDFTKSDLRGKKTWRSGRCKPPLAVMSRPAIIDFCARHEIKATPLGCPKILHDDAVYLLGEHVNATYERTPNANQTRFEDPENPSRFDVVVAACWPVRSL